MKNLILLFLLFICFSVGAQEPAYYQWQNYLITPKYDQMQAFGEAMHQHNKKFHQGASSAASVWRITSGQNIGKWVLSRGPYTFEGMDNIDIGGEHMADLRNNVMPYIESIEDGGTWRMVADNSYMPAEGAQITKARVIIHDMSGNGGEGYQSAMKKLAQATAKGMPGTARIFLRRVGFHNDHMDNVVFIGLNKWADLDNNVVNAYEELHGEGSWDLFLEEVGDAIKSSVEEHWIHVPYLSGIGGDE